MRDMIENLKAHQDLDREVEEAEAKEAEKAKFGGLESIFGANNPIMELVMETAQDPELQK